MPTRSIEVAARFCVRVPRTAIAAVDASVPAWDRLAALARLTASSVVDLDAELTRLGADWSNLVPQERTAQAEICRQRLGSLSSDAVWLLPKHVAGKFPYREHLRAHLDGQAAAVLAFGLRDTYQNRFKWAFEGGGKGRGLLTRPGEPLDRRSYAVIYSAGDDPSHLAIGEAHVANGTVQVAEEARPIRFAVAAAPLVWDGVPLATAVRLAYQADLRHEFHLPPSTWKTIHPQLQSLLGAPGSPAQIGAAVEAEAARLGLAPENGYYLASVGVDEEGGLILVSAHGSPADLAALQINAGAVRAVLTEEGGSCAYALWEAAKDFAAAGNVQRNAAGVVQYEPAPRLFGMTTYWRESAIALGVVRLKTVIQESPFRDRASSTFAGTFRGRPA